MSGPCGESVVGRVNKMPAKKKGFFKRIIANLVREAWDDARDSSQKGTEVEYLPQITKNQSIDNDKFIRFTIYAANGGRVVETYRRAQNNSRNINSLDELSTNLYVITSEKDFGREIDKILTMESLR